MPLLDGERLIRAHLDANPDANRAALHDAQHAATVHQLRTVLDRLGHALAAEGVTDEALAARVGARLVTDLLGTDEATARMQARAKAVRALYEQHLVRMPVRTDLLGAP